MCYTITKRGDSMRFYNKDILKVENNEKYSFALKFI